MLTGRALSEANAISRGNAELELDTADWPIFNIADMAVNIGAALLILSSVLSVRSARRDPAEDGDCAAGLTCIGGTCRLAAGLILCIPEVL